MGWSAGEGQARSHVRTQRSAAVRRNDPYRASSWRRSGMAGAEGAVR